MLANYMRTAELLGMTSGRIEKEDILRNIDDERMKEIFRFVYDPMITTGLAKKKIEKDLSHVECKHFFENLFDAMEFLKVNNTGSDSIIKSVQVLLENTDEDCREFVKSVLVKDLPIGISSTTLNKVYGKNFIPKYSVMLASKWQPGTIDLSNGFVLTLKLDGIRATVFNYEDGVRIFARSGKEITGLVELEKTFQDFPKGMVYDGELIAESDGKMDSKDLFRLTQSIVRKNGDKFGVNFGIFDMLPIDEFKFGKSKDGYMVRVKKMRKVMSETVKSWHRLFMAPVYYEGTDESVIAPKLEEVLRKGKEGLMINTMNGVYETKRSKNLMKVKEFHNVDLRIIGVVEHTRGNRLGSIVVDYKGNQVNVGSGFNDADRVRFWQNKDKLIGKIAEVQYFEESNNQSNDSVSLRFPVFITMREDKNEVSYS